MLSWFKATVIVYLKHSLFLFFGFIVAPLALNHSGESIYDVLYSNLFCEDDNTMNQLSQI